jgi:hypothetical protein
MVCIFSVNAQTNRKDTVLTREMTLEKEYNPTIRDAVKLNQIPELREPQAPKTQVEFSNFASPFDVKPGLMLLNPKAYLTDMNYAKQRGYLTLGVSSLLDINGDFGYQILHTPQDYLSVFLSHRSSNSNVKNLQIDENQKFKINDNLGGLNYTHNFEKVKLDLGAKYTYSAFNYSGLNIANLQETENAYFWSVPPVYEIAKFPTQVNNIFDTHAGVSSDVENELNYKVGLEYSFFNQRYGSVTSKSGLTENRVVIDLDFHKKINSTMGVGLGGYYKTFSYSSEEYRMNSNGITRYSLFSLNPYFYLEDDNLDLTLGAKPGFELGGRKKMIVAPVVDLKFYPSDRFLAYLNVDGGIQENSKYTTYYENRYAGPLSKIRDSRSPFDGTVGIKFLPLSVLSVDVFTGYKITKDEHFFYHYYDYVFTESTAGSTISSIYENANVSKLGSNIKYAYQDRFEIDLKGVYYYWDIIGTSNLNDFNFERGIRAREPWGKPNFEADLSLMYRVESLPLQLNLLYHGAFGRKMTTNFDISNNLNADGINMKDINDLSLKATYSFTKSFSAYLSGNNLLFQKYDIWYAYPAQGFNIIGGINFLF